MELLGPHSKSGLRRPVGSGKTASHPSDIALVARSEASWLVTGVLADDARKHGLYVHGPVPGLIVRRADLAGWAMRAARTSVKVVGRLGLP
jgi:hypothetical protein